MNKSLKKELNSKDNCNHYDIPDSIEISKEDQTIIENMVDILCHERFCHDGWLNYDHYKQDACYFLLKLVRGEYTK